MRYILYIYTGKDYGITEEDLEDLLNLFKPSHQYNGLNGGFWWPIGCASHTDKCTSNCTPVSTKITSHFGNRPSPGGGGTIVGHGAIDIANPSGPYIIASKGGIVKYATPNGGTFGTRILWQQRWWGIW
jgi:murein DD-endopeptidase MepM/ murein hydrolase activator NlpD